MATASKESADVRKLALIIANGSYRRPENEISNCANNVNQLTKSLQSMDFQVEKIVNKDKHEIISGVLDFIKKIQDGDVVFCYWLGQGSQVDEKNYFLPADDSCIQNERHIEEFAVEIEPLFKRLVKQNPSYATVLVLDCCRPYYLGRTSKPICELFSIYQYEIFRFVFRVKLMD